MAVGDEFLIIGATTGAYEDTANELRVDLKAVDRVQKGEFFSLKTEVPIRRNDKLYKMEIVDKQIL